MNKDGEIFFTRGVPPVESFPTEKLACCANDALKADAKVILQYGKAGGYPPLREHLARELGVKDNQIILGQGSLLLLDFVVRTQITPGDVVYLESPSYDRAITIMQRSGAKVIGIPLEMDGPSIDVVEKRLKSGERPKFFYIIPDFQNPSGAELSLGKRKALADLAAKYDFFIIEDIPYRKLRYQGEEAPTLFSINPENVILMSSYSKQIGPGLRVGYQAIPLSMTKLLHQFIEDTYICPSYFVQAVVYEFIKKGWLEGNLEMLRNLYRPRLEATLEALDANMTTLGTWCKPQGGFFVSLNVTKKISMDQLLERAKQESLILTDGRGFFCDGSGDNFIRLPFCALTPQEIQEGVQRLGRVIRSL